MISLRTLIAYLYIGSVVSPFVDFFTTYMYNDVDYLIFLGVIVSLDTVLGFTIAVINHKVSPEGFGKFWKKLISYISALVMSHVLVSFTIHDKPFLLFSWMDKVVFSAVMVNEAISICENLAILSPGLVPAKLMRYFKNFDSFTGKSKENETEIKPPKSSDGNNS